jgi:hypothetical protein
VLQIWSGIESSDRQTGIVTEMFGKSKIAADASSGR